MLQTRFKFVEAATRFELVVKVLQTCALPLGYAAKKVERKTRFELATLALARRCSTTEPLPHMVEESGFEPLKAELTDLQSVPFGQLGNSSKFGAGGRT